MLGNIFITNMVNKQIQSEENRFILRTQFHDVHVNLEGQMPLVYWMTDKNTKHPVEKKDSPWRN